MKFLHANLAYSLFWAITALFLFYMWALKKRRDATERFAQKGLADMLTTFDIKKYKIKTSLIILALFFAFISLMRPQWGFHWQKIKRVGLDILIALDTSKSMLAEDVKPNRLERSKLAVKDLVKKLKGDRIGLIAFSGSAFLQCPLTVDYGGFMLTLDEVDVHTIPKGGTSISSAVKKAIESYKGGMKKYKILIIITDGEDHEGDPIKYARQAKEEGIKIFCIGIGTKEGGLIPINDKRGKHIFLKDRSGNVVKTSLNEKILQDIASMTGGTYVRATGADFGLDFIYEQKLSKIEKREIESRMKRSYKERFQLPLAAALILLFFEPFITQRRGTNTARSLEKDR